VLISGLNQDRQNNSIPINDHALFNAILGATGRILTAEYSEGRLGKRGVFAEKTFR
jgi:hypothetical protein